MNNWMSLILLPRLPHITRLHVLWRMPVFTILCETPITVTLPTADLIIERAKANNVKLEIAENYYRVPRERFYQR